MSDLVGKAQEADDAFWGHDTWEEDDSGNDSFHESDEDSDVRKDHFDSDFNESEEDVSDAEMAAGRLEEAELRHQEKQDNRKKTSFDVAKAGRDLLQKKKGAKGRIKGQRIFGDGINAGLVLNRPQDPTGLPLPLPIRGLASQATTITSTSTAAVTTTKATLTSTRPRRSRFISLRATTQVKSALDAMVKPTTSKVGTSTKQSRAKYFTQEQLLVEAATITEAENNRWLLGRKRLHEQVEASIRQDLQLQSTLRFKYRSRRGMLTTLTFADMDAVPDILVPRPAPVRPKPVYCVITGKRAKYKCPKTNQGYYNSDAFRELRRRFAAGEPLEQRSKQRQQSVDEGVDSIKMQQQAVPMVH